MRVHSSITVAGSLRRGNPQIATNLSGEIIVDFSVARDGRRHPFPWVVEDGVPGAFTNEYAALSGEMPEEIAPLHTSFSEFDGDDFAAGASRRFSKKAVFFQNEVERLFQISTGLHQCLTLSIYTRNLLHPRDVPSALLLNHGGEFSRH